MQITPANHLITVITVCFNAVNTISQTIRSIETQTYKNIQYIVIDGGSTDGTVDLILANRHVITKFVSEKDGGIYDAMNKGIALAEGVVIGIINADDFYLPDTIERVAMEWVRSACIDVFVGNTLLLSRDRLTLQFRPILNVSYERMNVPHPSAFVSKDAYLKFNSYKTFRYAGDREFFFRLKAANAKFKIIDADLAIFRAGGYGSRVGLLGLIENFKIDHHYINYFIAIKLFLYRFFTAYLRQNLVNLLVLFRIRS
jgi:glycosyltransferase involved in cell wall biosynthesis